MSKHTPGPWEAVNAVNVFTRLGSPRADGVEAPANDGWHIADMGDSPCFVDGDEVGLSHEERKANARLIAAAPELLEALRGLIEIGSYLDKTEYESEYNAAHAAIAKATGEQP